MRILMVTHAPLSAEYGAAQVALNLGEALRAIGHDVTLWSPHPLQSRGRWWKSIRAMRSKLDAFIGSQPVFDVIDAPASLITTRLRRDALVVVRSVQPDLSYLAIGMLDGLQVSPMGLVRLFDRAMQFAYHAYLVLLGWKAADLIVCMGRLELQWMKRFFPWWTEKLRFYVVALSSSDQERLREVRAKRVQADAKRGVRFLWIGRWARHKGNVEVLHFAEKWLAVRPWDQITIAGCGNAVAPTIRGELIESRRIEVVPVYDRDELPTLLAAHDVGLFTSKVEGWGLALNEMLESGMPVYATRAGGVPDLSAHVVGRLRAFPPSASDCGTEGSGNPDWEAYYGTFSWPAIAREYSENLTSMMNDANTDGHTK